MLRENLKVCHTMNEKYTQQLILMKEIVKKKEVIHVHYWGEPKRASHTHEVCELYFGGSRYKVQC